MGTMQTKTAILIGATGLVGSHVLEELDKHPGIGAIKVFSRRPVENGSHKMKEYLIDFEQIEDYKEQITGDVLFSCLGTTLKKAGSKENQFKIDVTYQDKFASFAAQNKIPAYFLVSAPNANTKSFFFYSRIKGELEERIKAYPFDRIRIFRPSVLTGSRPEVRPGEEWGAWFMNKIGRHLPFLRKYKPIPGAVVAHAMIHEYFSPSDSRLESYDLQEIFELDAQ